MPRTVGCRVFVDWDFNGAFTEESENLVSVSGSMRFAPPEQSIASSSGIVDTCEIELYNRAGRYSPLNTAGALYAYTQAGGAYQAPVYVQMMIDGSNYATVFTGVTRIPQETGRAVDEVPTVRLNCHSRDELLRQRRMSTTQSGMVTRFLTGFDEAQIIAAFLAAAGATPTSIDAGMITIPWSWMDDESPLEEIWQIAAACGGRFYATPGGTFAYENMAHWTRTPHTVSQQTYTPADWQRLEAWYEDDDLYNSVTVEYSSRTPEAVTVLWEPDEEVLIPAGSTRTIWANYSYPAYSIDSLEFKAGTNGGIDLTGSVSITATYFAQRAKLVITNAHATYAATLTPFQIQGRAVMGGPTAEVERNSAEHGSAAAATFWGSRSGRTLRMAGNVYIQSRAQAGMLAQFLLDRHELPRLHYRLSGCPGAPARRCGDRITINDASVMSSGRDALIVGIEWQYQGMAYSQTVEAIDAAGLYPAGAYFVIGTNTLGAGSSSPGVVFY